MSTLMSTVFKHQYDTSHLQGANATYVEWLYEQFLAEPGSVPPEWRQYFSTLAAPSAEIAARPDRSGHCRTYAATRRSAGCLGRGRGAPAMEKQAAVSRLIQVYSLRGHPDRRPRPAWAWERPRQPCSRFDFLGLDESDLQREFSTAGSPAPGHTRMKLQDILALLKQIYCGKLAAEFAHISRARERLWLREQFEACRVHGRCRPTSKRRFSIA
jgi:2-oxoglutarate dehydrogenase E1 component